MFLDSRIWTSQSFTISSRVLHKQLMSAIELEGSGGSFPGFGIRTTEASLQDGEMSPVFQMLLKSLRRICRQRSGRCLRNC
ncbi:hypothetical protein PoB_006408900 [Plakobranchus ocellatus]|uniref:Uncharacterized protein n=1 Tax=Plakobranchus ocellatus TaxID=259542 RepID=A0AAV4D059_9GAST|nr:hypothetical protein PoB_006408900 [Plakobranchus ocellatus]